MKNDTKEIKKLKEAREKLVNSCFEHYGFCVENDEGFLSITQKREGGRKQKNIMQFSQVCNLISCIDRVKDDYNKARDFDDKIDMLKKVK